MKTAHYITQLFPLWAILLSTLALFQPDFFVPLKPYIIPLLIVVMLGMGFTLTWPDFQKIMKQPRVIVLGVALQYTVMPLAAFLIAKLFSMPMELLIGMLLVGASAGGTASNVITYLAKGDLALSISMTLLSTLLAVLALPLLTWLYIGQMVYVPVSDMFISLFKLILLPIIIGTTLNTLYHKQIKTFEPVFPLISTIAIVVIIAIVVALNQENIQHVAGTVVTAVILHNSLGLLAGFWLIKKLGYTDKVARTVAIEVGMQNSGLSVALALKYFTTASALPGALFSIWHNLSGSLLAAYWRRK